MESKFKDYPKDDRIEMLEGSCDQLVENYSWVRELSEEEILELQTELSEAMIELKKRQAILKQVTSQMRQEMKPLQNRNDDILIRLETRTITETCKAFAFRDYDANQVLYYNQEGDLIDSRRMLPHERQTTILQGLNRVVNE